MKWNLWNRLFNRCLPVVLKASSKPPRFVPQLLSLEDRVVPATISLAGGSLIYTGTNVANALDFSLDMGTYTFHNELDPFTGAAPAGVTYTDTDMNGSLDTATVLNTAVNLLTFNMGTDANTVNLGTFDAAIDPITVNGGGNAASTLNVITGGAGLTTMGDVVLKGLNTINIDQLVTAANVTFEADQMNFNQAINVGAGSINLSTLSANRLIQLGTASGAGQLGFTQAQLDNLTTSVLTIDNAAVGGDIQVAGNITFNPARVPTLTLSTAGNIFGAGTLNVNNLAFATNGDVTLTGAWNNVGGTSLGSINLTATQSLTVDTVDGFNLLFALNDVNVTVQGSNNLLTVTNPISSENGNITLTADRMAINNDVNAGDQRVTLQPFTAGRLVNVGTNDSGTTLGLIAAEIDQVVAGTLQIGSGTAGNVTITANTTPANVSTLRLASGGIINSGAFTVTIGNLAFVATGDVTLTGAWNNVAGTSGGAVTLTDTINMTIDTVDGINVLSSNNNLSVTVQGANNLLTVAQPVSSATGTITLTSDRQAINSNVTATNNRVTLQPLTAGRLIDVGGNDTATTLGFLTTELGLVTAGTLQLGRANAGNISVTANVNAGSINALTLVTGGSATGAGVITTNALRVAATTGPVNLFTSINTLAGTTNGSFTLSNGTTLTIANVDGVDGVTAGGAVNISAQGALNVARNVSSTGAATVTLTTVDAAGTGQNILVNSGVVISSAGGNVNLNAGDNLTVAGGATVQTSGAGQIFFRIDFNTADAVGGVLQAVGATISAPAGATYLGNIHDDSFTASGSVNTAILVDGGDATAGFNSLNFDGSGVAVTINGNILTAAGRQPLTFLNINKSPIFITNATSVTLNGTAGNDNVTLFGTPSSGVEVQLNSGFRFNIGNIHFNHNGLAGTNTVTLNFQNGNAFPSGGVTFTNVTAYVVVGTDGDDTMLVQVHATSIDVTFNSFPLFNLPNVTSFAFDGGLGNDKMQVNYDAAILSTIAINFNGGTGAFNDALAVIAPGHTGNYLPDAVNSDAGVVNVEGSAVTFTSLAPVDIAGFLNFTAFFPNAVADVTLSAGAGVIIPHAAIVMTGTSGAVPFELMAIWSVTNFTIDTTMNQGADTITINGTGAGGVAGHNVRNLSIVTGDFNDLVSSTGGTNLDGNLLISTGNENDTITMNGSVSVGGNYTIDAGAGNDAINTGAGATSTVGGNLLWLGGANEDTFTSNGNLSVTGTLTVDAGTGNNFVTMAGVINSTGDMLWTANGGNDTFTSTANITANSNFTVNVGDGTNSVAFNAGPVRVLGNLNWFSGSGVDTWSSVATLIVSGGFTATLGGNSDTLSITTTTVTGAINISGDAGNDSVSIQGVTSGSSVTITAETININADLTATTGAVQLLLVNQLNVAGVTVSGRTGISQTGGMAPPLNVVFLTGTGGTPTSTFTSALGAITFEDHINGTTAGVQNLTITAQTNVVLQNIGNTVRLGALNVTSTAGDIQLNGTTYNAGPQTYTTANTQSTIVFAGTVTFSGVDQNITFNSPLIGNTNGTSDVIVNTTGNTIFNQPVGLPVGKALRTLTTDLGGITFFRGGSVTTTLNQNYQDDVRVNAANTLFTTRSNGSITFGRSLNVETDGTDICFETGTGAINFNGNVGNEAPRIRDVLIKNAGNVTIGAALFNTFTAAGLNQLAGTGITTFNAITNITNLPASTFAILTNITNNSIVLNNNLTSALDTRFNANVNGVTQNGGVFSTRNLIFAGTGNFTMNNINNVVSGTFEASVNGTILLAALELRINPNKLDAITTSNDNVTLRTGGNFTSNPTVAHQRLINLGMGNFQVYPGQLGNSVVTFNSEVIAATVNLGQPLTGVQTNPNVFQDTFLVAPSNNVIICVWGNIPTNNFNPALNDLLSPNFAFLNPGVTVSLNTNSLGNGSLEGTYTFSDSTKALKFNSIEGFGNLQLNASIFQTTAGNFQVVLNASFANLPTGQLDFPLPRITIPRNTFVVNPRLVNPNAPYGAPRITMGDINADGTDDLVLAAGSNESPLVFVLNGNRLLDTAAGKTTLELNASLPREFYLGQFLAYELEYMGGLNVAVGPRTAGSTKADIYVSPDGGRQGDVRIFSYDPGMPMANPPVAPSIQWVNSPANGFTAFTPYGPDFTGGVRLALRQVNAANSQLITAPGNGLPVGFNSEIKVFDANDVATNPIPPAALNSFNPYLDLNTGVTYPSYKGSLYIATGTYSNNGTDDLVVGPGTGMPSRVRVFTGNLDTNPTPAAIADFVAFGAERSTGLVAAVTVNNTGVGGVAFSLDSTTGKRTILVGSGAGQLTQLRQFQEVANNAAPFTVGVAANPNIFTIFPAASAIYGKWNLAINGVQYNNLDIGITQAALNALLQPKFGANVTVIRTGSAFLPVITLKFANSFVTKAVPNVVVTSASLVGTDYTITPTNPGAKGTWTLKIGTKTLTNLAKDISAADLKLKLETLLGAANVQGVSRSITGTTRISLNANYILANKPVVSTAGSMAGKVTNLVAMAGTFTTSDTFLQDYTGKKFRYDALLISELATNRYRDGAASVSSRVKTVI